MEQQTFIAGVEPGGFTHDYEIKILICYLLLQLEQPLSFAQMSEILQDEGIVNYFEFSDALSKLLQSQHIVVFKTENGENFYTISELGAKTALTFQKSLPYTVRHRIVQAAQEMITKSKSESENIVSITKAPDGYLAVSYTHLDVYKRQAYPRAWRRFSRIAPRFCLYGVRAFFPRLFWDINRERMNSGKL